MVAALRAISVMPGNERQNESPFGTFSFNFRNTGGSGNYPTRNYFLFYANSDGYNTERFEFARGPNSLLFGDAALGGVQCRHHPEAVAAVQRSLAHENGGVGVAEFHDFESAVDPELAGELEALIAGIIDGSIEVTSPASPGQ
mgnify:CR=1 FL=1